jgi:hypothetical protein
MIHEIAKIAKIPFDEKNERLMAHLRRVERKMPLNVEVDVRNKSFKTATLLAFVAVHKEGPEAPVVKETLDGPRVLKIRSVPKGERLETVAPNLYPIRSFPYQTANRLHFLARSKRSPHLNIQQTPTNTLINQPESQLIISLKSVCHRQPC